MTRTLFLALVLPLLAAESAAQFLLHDQQFTALFAVLALGVCAVRWVLGPRPADDCLADCPKCAESSTEGNDDWGGPEDRFIWEPGDWEDYR